MTTMDELEHLLERQYRFLEKHAGIVLVRQTKLFLQVLIEDPRLHAIILDLVREADRAMQELEAFDTRLLPELTRYRHELAHLAPECDDSQMTRPDPDMSSDYENTFAFFDAYLTGVDKPLGIPLEVTPNDDRTRFKTLLRIVEGKVYSLVRGFDLQTGTHRPETERRDLVPLQQQLRVLEAKHDHRYRAFLDFRSSQAGFAWYSLQRTLEELNPTPQNEWEISPAELNYRLARAFHGAGQVLNKALYGTTSLGGTEQEQVDRAAEFIRGQCERLYEEVMLRLGMQRSHQALIERYKYRCEWHEQASLRQMVQADSTSTPEDDLARHLALWLFDQGLNPMTKMRAGNLEPDLLDPLSRMSLYVEAKQYRDANGTRAYLIKGIGQMVDTMARLSGTPYQVHEGYYVVYRRLGPRYVFPPVLKYGPFTIYPVLIDIAESRESGSRQKHKPIIIGEDELSGRDVGLADS